MAKKPGRRKSGGFLPVGASALLARWAFQAGGVVVIFLGFAMTAALVTYDAQDASFNTAAAAGHSTGNMLGGLGAYFSDSLLQVFGLASGLAVLSLFAWGGRLAITGRPLRQVPLRCGLLVCGVLLTAVGLAAVPAFGDLHLPGQSQELGGSLGRVLLDGLGGTGVLLGLGDISWVMAVLCGALGVVCTFYALGLSRDEWRAVGQSAMQAGNTLGQAGGRLREMSGSLADRRRPLAEDEPREPSFEPAEEEPSAPAADAVSTAETPERRAEPLLAPRASRAQPGRREKEDRQGRLDLSGERLFILPPLHLLAEAPINRSTVNDHGLEANARLLKKVLEDFGVNGEIVKVRPGPVVTLYELEPAPGTKTSRVIGLADDIARSMSKLSVRVATVPGRSVIGIEMPNLRRETVFLRELLASEAFEKAPAPLTLVAGKDIGGQPIMVDLARMPHLLIAGTTGSGKSVAINTMILSLLYRLKPEQCRMILIDPKMLELSVYDRIPHLLTPVVTEPGKAVVALKWAVREMEDRYRAMSQLGVRNIAGYNQRLEEARQKGEGLARTVQTGFDPDTGKPIYEEQPLDLLPLPFIVIVVDEMADLMLVAGKDIESAVQRLAQMARAAGIHLIMATQRPSVDVITGTIKANFPSRISFQVSSKIDSRTILGEQGAEQLLGQGDMLYMASGGRITRVHGPFVSDQEVESVVEHLRGQGDPAYLEGVTEGDPQDAEAAQEAAGGGSSGDDLYDQAVAMVLREGKVSTSFVQRQLQVGYNRAARMVERMEQEGVVSRPNHLNKREVLGRSQGD